MIDCLLDIPETDTSMKIRIADVCRRLLENDKQVELYRDFVTAFYHSIDGIFVFQGLETSASVIRLAAACIGHIARIATAAESDHLKDSFLSTAFKWINEQRSEVHRFSGVLVLTQLAMHIPVHIYDQKNKLFDGIFETISDRNSVIRISSADALKKGEPNTHSQHSIFIALLSFSLCFPN